MSDHKQAYEFPRAVKEAMDRMGATWPESHSQDLATIRAHIEGLEAEVAQVRGWNERVSVCRDHTAEIVDGDCVVCRAEAAEARVKDLSPLNYEERCRLRDAEARIAELKRVAEDAINLAEAAERDAGMLRDTLRECLPYVDSHAKASHLTDGFKPQPANKHDELAARVSAIATTEQADED